MSSVLVWYKTNSGQRTGLLVKAGRKFMHVVTMDTYPLRVQKVRLSEGKYMRVMDYPIKRALKIYRGIAKRDHGPVANWPANLKEALG